MNNARQVGGILATEEYLDFETYAYGLEKATEIYRERLQRRYPRYKSL